MRSSSRVVLSAAFACVLAACAPPRKGVPETLRTVAERTNFEATALYADVLELVDRLVALDPTRARREDFGTSVEGRALPLLVVGEPPCATPEQARADDKLVVLLLGNIHAGEVCGKEALLMFARDLLLNPRHPDNRAILEHCVLLIAPIYNPDGNERVDVGNRPGQNGPIRGMGQRANAQRLDLNRDYVKLEAPESRALAALYSRWNPALSIDTHTTNGSFHRYELTYDGPMHPATERPLEELVRARMLPEVTRRLFERTGYRTFFYGNFDAKRTSWETYSSQPRFGDPYRGLRQRACILSEAYAYADFRTRVDVTLEFVRECLDLACEWRETLIDTLDRAEAETIAKATRPGSDPVPIRTRMAAAPQPVTILGVVETTDADGKTHPTATPHDVTVLHYDHFEGTLAVERPRAYLIPPQCESIVENLRRHGVRVDRVEAPFDARVDVQTVTRVTGSTRAFEGHHEISLDTSTTRTTRTIPAGWSRVDLAQPLGTLCVILLEPQCEDGLVTWNFFDPWIAPGAEFPVLREVRDGAP
ncbi:MAG: M14 family metallopeptidase [Planctomycetes bacterium]|nr:M14 family metallopeptidase [Planctomycetota bacterium]